MRLFVIQAYGGRLGTDGHIRHFLVHAENAEEALELIKDNPSAARYDHIEVTEEPEPVTADKAEIVAEGDGPYTRL